MKSYTDSEGGPRYVKIVAHVIIGLIVIGLLFGSFGTVGAGERGVLVRFQAVVGTKDPGLYFKIPFIESVKIMDVRTQTVKYELEDPLFAASKDLQDVKISTLVNYHLDPTAVLNIYQQYGQTGVYEANVIRPIVRDVVKATASQYTAEELVTKRVEFNDNVTAALTERLEPKSVVVERVNITNFEFSKSFTEAIEAKVTAVQNAEAAKNKLEQVKFEAQQTIEKARAEAEAIRIQAQAINSQGGTDFVELQRITKWDGHACTSYCGLDASTGLLIQPK